MCSPAAMAGQPCSWAAVGAGNVVSNQARTGWRERSQRSDPDKLSTPTGQPMAGTPSVRGWPSAAGGLRAGGDGAGHGRVQVAQEVVPTGRAG